MLESYVIHDTKLPHDGGTHNLEVEIDGGQAVIRFGSSFTLRLDEDGVNQLTDVLADTLGCLRTVRREYTQSAEDQMVQAGIDAREAVKQKKLKPQKNQNNR